MKIRNSILTLLRFLGLTITLLTSSVFLSISQATILYDADALSTFTLDTDGGMTITATAGMDPAMTATTGTGTASIDADSVGFAGMMPFTPGMTLTQMSEVSGSAAPPSGASLATVMNGILITLDNSLSMSSSVAAFTFSYSWFNSVIQTDPIDAMKEEGFASSFFHLTGFAPSGGETLAIDDGLGGGPIAVADWLVHPAAGLSFADTGPSMTDMGMATVTAFVTVPAGSIDAFSVITDAMGGAVHVPVPPVWMLMLVGAVLFRRSYKNYQH